MEFQYERLENRILLDNLKNEVIGKTLAYMVDFREHNDLVVIPKQHSIEISNADICIAVILFSGFEKEEYEALVTKDNFHIVSFDTIMQTMFEFKNMFIKHIDSMALFFMSLARTDDTNVFDILRLKNLSVNKTILNLSKTYLRNDLVWNQDLFSLLYKKNKTNENSKKIKNKFASSMVMEGLPEAISEANLESINSSYINEFVKCGVLLDKKEIVSELGEKKPLFIGFGVASGKKRGKKAIGLALSNLNLYVRIVENIKTILLIISSDSIEIGIEEIGEINDVIQEKVGSSTRIINTVSSNKNLGKSLSITILISEFEIEGNS
ncbi:FtsZ/tubulin family protein [Flavobacterium soyangense]|uniref:Cell division protein FtsZ C-terminal domain-containing protein n=1 Tax=Flavobacterium soyangense TaxID=2023265 RepID=A0A930UFD1_9FLAO|nr:hypothetical protein [Flavobacterium soyangense]MBF2709754.1 hypothetical protein [Flavobacterium soyangense]